MKQKILNKNNKKNVQTQNKIKKIYNKINIYQDKKNNFFILM